MLFRGRLAALVMLAAFWAPAARSAPPPRDPAPDANGRRLVPRKPPAEVYESRPATETSLPVFGDPLRAAIRKAAIDNGRTRGLRVLPDVRLDEAMNDLAHALREDESPYGEAVEFVLSHHGIVEPYPQLSIVHGSRDDDAGLRRAVLQSLPLPAGPGLVTIGVGADRQTSSAMVVVALQDKTLDLDAVPRHLPHDGHARVAGMLLGKMGEPRLYVTEPQGQPRALPATVTGAAFHGEISCARGDGRYQVEVFGTDDRGPRVLANFPVFCGTPTPTNRPGAAGYDALSLKPAEAEARMLELVNRERRVAGLAPVVLDAALSAVARGHSQDMLGSDFTGHISPTTGGPADRVRRAGLTVPRFFENVGRGGSLEDVHSGLMRSPAHRLAILDKDVRAVGIGVAVGTGESASFNVLATQLFR